MPSNCTCEGLPGLYCRVHGCPHDGVRQPLAPRGCDCIGIATTRAAAERAEARPAQAPVVDAMLADADVTEYDDEPQPWRREDFDMTETEPAEVDMVNHPPHYKSHPSGVECIEITRHLSFDVGNAVKYVFRSHFKNGREDIEKASWYLLDALDNGTACFLPSWNFEIDQKLDRVLDAEAHPNRLVFFSAIGRGNIRLALKAVEGMLDNG